MAYSNLTTVIPRLTDLPTSTSNMSKQSNITVIDKCSMDTTAINIVYSTFLICVVIVSVLGNALVCVAILTSRRLRARKTNHFIASLAVSDLLFTLSVTSTRASSAIYNQSFCHTIHLCKAYIILDGISTTASITCLFVIAIDRYLAVCMPYKYPQLMNRKRAILVIVLAWCYAIFWGSLSTFNWETPSRTGIFIDNVRHTCVNYNLYFYATSLTVVYLIPLVVMALVYLRILNIAFIHAKAIRATAVETSQPTTSSKRNGTTRRGSKSKRKQELKATKTLAIVYGTFVVCWSPSCLVNIILLLNPIIFVNLQKKSPLGTQIIYFTFVEIFPIMSAALNPFIYSICSKQFREGFKLLLVRMLGRYAIVRNSRNTRTTVGERETSFVELEPYA